MMLYKKEVRMVPLEKIEPIEMHCDICGKVIDTRNWFSVSTHHSDWGNDSFESLEFYDICSDKCVMEFAGKYVSEAYGGVNTKTIEIEHRRCIREIDDDRDKIIFEDYVAEKED